MYLQTSYSIVKIAGYLHTIFKESKSIVQPFDKWIKGVTIT